ncbi:MAG TPA: C25 family cysteine peptidase, partial [Chitinophagaceae bacterium]
MKKLLVIFLLFSCKMAVAQTYNNEWIDYSKTYYKFRIGATGLYRINGSDLPPAIAGASAEQFQLWRNGKRVTLYTSVASGPLTGGYIEFWGEKNDGVPDKPMYLNPNFQLSDRLSLETDTAAYFLTINPSVSGNPRFTTEINDVASNSLPAQQYFMHTARVDFRQIINRGKAVNLGLYVYSSSYDEGEWWSSLEFRSAITSSTPVPAQPLVYSFDNLRPFTSGPASAINASVAGSASNNRNIRATVNGTEVFNNPLNGFSATIMSGNVATSSLSNNTEVKLSSEFVSSTAADRAVAGFIELYYPRTWDFNNQDFFEFSLPATPAVYIEITNFNAGSQAPVLYDLSNNRRYVADIAVAGKYRFVLPADAARKFVLVSQSSGIRQVTAFQQKNFVNFSNTAYQGDYLLITNSLLRASGDPVEQYRAYRSSANGGGYNAKIYDIDELTDQFAFGIHRHPLSVKNFLRFARNTFPVPPKMLLLVGRGVSYDQFAYHESDPDANRLNLVPTFGYPGSDILLAANGLEPVQATPVGRIAAVSPQEVSAYLDKLIAYEAAQRNPVQTLADKEWMKNFIHVAGADDPGLDASLTARLNNYKAIIRDTFFGAKVFDFNKSTTGPTTVITDALLASLLKNGIAWLTYFGHGSSTNLAYNLPAVNTWNNTGKYPIFMMLGCNVGNFFEYDEGRLSVLQTLTERYIITPQLGGIGMIASTHFGTEFELDAYAQRIYNAVGRTQYNKPVGYAMQEANQLLQPSSVGNFVLRLHLEQHLLHGDPALKPNAFPKPDYVVEEQDVVLNPTFISVADTAVNVKAYVHNIAKAVGHASSSSVALEVKRRYPDGSSEVVYTKDISPAVRNIDSVSFSLPIVPTRDKGENRLTVTIDYKGQYDELSETNNSAEKTFFVFEDELRPVYPYNFAIINRNNAKLVASTADPLLGLRSYVMEMDTTAFFNS